MQQLYVRLFLAVGDEALRNELHRTALSMPDRVSIVGLAPTASLIRQNLAVTQPEVLILDAEMAQDMEGGEREFLNLVSETANLVTIVLLPPQWQQLGQRLDQVAQVRGVYPKPVNAGAIIDAAIQAGLTDRQRREEIAPGAVDHRGLATRRPTSTGQHVITVITFKKGGVGKTTIAANLWHWYNTQVGESLLVGFDCPDDIGVMLGLPPEPNMMNFFRRPGPQGFEASMQEYHDHDVILSPGDDAQAQRVVMEAGGAEPISNLIMQARDHKPYVAIIMDVPPSYDDWSLEPLARANRVLLVLEPAMTNLIKAVDGIRLVSTRLDPRYRVAREKIFVVLNKVTERTNMGVRDLEGIFRKGLGGWSPPIIASIPYDARVTADQVDNRITATVQCPFSEGIGAIGQFFTQQDRAMNVDERKGKGFRLPRIRIG